MSNQINDRKKLISSYDQDVKITNSQIKQLTGEVTKLTGDHQRMSTAYGKAIRSMYRLNQTQNKWLFLLSGANLNQLFLRWQYLRQVKQSWSQQLSQLKITADSLSVHRDQLEVNKKKKEALRADLNLQKRQLDSDMNRQQKLLNVLRKDEKKLRKKLAEYRKSRERLNEAIRGIIEAEMGISDSGVLLPETPASRRLSKGFSGNKGKLPWPVETGIITKIFGKQRHPTLRNVTIVNNGIDIKTSPGAQVKAVFEGRVVGQQQIPGIDHMVIVQHGQFYTVYSFLSKIFVTPGDRIRIGDVIGTARDKDGLSEVHLEIWQGKELQDPQNWLVGE